MLALTFLGLYNPPIDRTNGEGPIMGTAKYVYWQEEDAWLGYLEEYPDYWTQGDSLDDLIEHLKDLHLDMSSGLIPSIRKVGELTLS